MNHYNFIRKIPSYEYILRFSLTRFVALLSQIQRSFIIVTNKSLGVLGYFSNFPFHEFCRNFLQQIKK